MKVHFIGTFNGNSQRVKNLSAMLSRSGYDVTLSARSAWGADLYRAVNWRILLRMPKIVFGLICVIATTLRTSAGVIVVCYPGYLDMMVIGPLARRRGIPIVYDPYISLYDTVVCDRHLLKKSSKIGKLLRVIERISLRNSSLVLADTPQHADLYQSLSGMEHDDHLVIWLGANEEIFFVPKPSPRTLTRKPEGMIVVFFHGTFVPLQGVMTIVEAARILRDEKIKFRIAGDGQEAKAVKSLVEQYGLSNFECLGMLNQKTLVQEIQDADICLGIFGLSAKASRVVPNKVFECAAIGRPIITQDSPAIRDAFSASEILACRRGDPENLAEQIRKLAEDGENRKALSINVHKGFMERFSVEAQASRLAAGLAALAGNS